MPEFEIIENGNSEIVIKKSRFIGELFSVHSKEEAEKILNETVKKYFDAKHHSYAYVIRDEGIEKASDDGEPSGTAGKQILFNLHEKNIINGLLIVTRYFGGVLLGTGGLCEAYRDSSLKAIESSCLSEILSGFEYFLIINYDDYGKIEYFLKQENIPYYNVEFLENVKMTAMVSKEKESYFEKNLNNISSGKIQFSRSDIMKYGMVDGKVRVF